MISGLRPKFEPVTSFQLVQQRSDKANADSYCYKWLSQLSLFTTIYFHISICGAIKYVWRRHKDS